MQAIGSGMTLRAPCQARRQAAKLPTRRAPVRAMASGLRDTPGVGNATRSKPKPPGANEKLNELRKSFLQADGTMDWDAVIEAELVRRRKCYEEPPESLNVRVDGTFYDVDDPLLDLIDEVPWKYWVMRFHMPEAEQVNGRAAMIGFAASYLTDAIFHVGPVAQCDSFFGKLFMFATFAGVALLRRTEDVDKFKQLYEEATFYDSQWQATLKELGQK